MVRQGAASPWRAIRSGSGCDGGGNCGTADAVSCRASWKAARWCATVSIRDLLRSASGPNRGNRLLPCQAQPEAVASALIAVSRCRPPRRARGSFGARYRGLTPAAHTNTALRARLHLTLWEVKMKTPTPPKEGGMGHPLK